MSAWVGMCTEKPCRRTYCGFVSQTEREISNAVCLQLLKREPKLRSQPQHLRCRIVLLANFSLLSMARAHCCEVNCFIRRQCQHRPVVDVWQEDAKKFWKDPLSVGCLPIPMRALNVYTINTCEHLGGRKQEGDHATSRRSRKRKALASPPTLQNVDMVGKSDVQKSLSAAGAEWQLKEAAAVQTAE